ncbi:MAG: hypothetical protein RLZZ390_811 [Bacteroidota bacterium]|jgi:hypothetical protein
MTKETDYLIQSLFEKESLEEMTLDEFSRLADQYPYSSIVQFLYSCKLKSVYHLDFPEQVTHTALFFSSPQWLHYQLSDESEKGNFRQSQYDRNYNNITEDQPIELPETTFDEDDENLWDNSLEDENALIAVEESTEPVHEEQITNTIPLVVEEVVEPSIPIEPYHTVDYFASQGIKTRLDDPQDDLGKKVRTFTAWLKTMKRLQPAAEINEIEESDEEIDTGLDQPVMQEIIATEAMAEVYLKQGLTQKAIEVYAKLSLQNPANSHIFAAKIIQIKENSI